MKKNPSLKVLAALLAMATMLGACSGSASDEVETETTESTVAETTESTEDTTTEDTEAE